MSDTKPYKVLKAISFRSDRVEIGATIHATDEEAKNIGVGEYLQPVEVTQGAESTPAEETPKEETGQETPGETTPPSEETTPPAEGSESAPADGEPADVGTETPAEETPKEEVPGETSTPKEGEEVA